MKITTIGWWNGQSNILDWFIKYFPENFFITAIVSMSDDGRTTWELMREYKKAFQNHLPPPWDLRRCLFSLSQSKYRELYKKIFETVFENNTKISDSNILSLFKIAFSQDNSDQKNFQELIHFLQKSYPEIIDISLPLNISLNWHKMGNILMAALFHHFWDFSKMIDFMNQLLEVQGKVLPVTTQSAYIQAVLDNWEIIETQDKISNICDYNWKISHLELMPHSQWANTPVSITKTIWESDYIILWPGDLFTSTIANLIIWGMKESIKNSQAKIVFILNNTNKWGETENFSVMDFIIHLERYLWRKIDILVANNKKLALNSEEKQKLQSDISVKWWEYIYISENEKLFLEWRGTQIVQWDFIDRDTLYKHHKKILCNTLLDLFNS